MNQKSAILIIGSTGRDIGKTEFACRIIEKHSPQNEIFGIKIVPVDKEEINCHRGIDGCGLCDSLTGDYQIIEETTPGTLKDTSRMLKAGAKKVYLLLVDRNYLKQGIEALLRLIPDQGLVVIESNSVRRVLEPGLFVVIKKKKDTFMKTTCAEVIELADKIIEFDNGNWDFDPDNVKIHNSRWMIQRNS